MYAQQMNLESTQFMTEQMKDTADQVTVMKQAQHALAQQMQQVKIDDVDELQEQMQDLWVRAMITVGLFRADAANTIACQNRRADGRAAEIAKELQLCTSGDQCGIGSVAYTIFFGYTSTSHRFSILAVSHVKAQQPVRKPRLPFRHVPLQQLPSPLLHAGCHRSVSPCTELKAMPTPNPAPTKALRDHIPNPVHPALFQSW